MYSGLRLCEVITVMVMPASVPTSGATISIADGICMRTAVVSLLLGICLPNRWPPRGVEISEIALSIFEFRMSVNRWMMSVFDNGRSVLATVLFRAHPKRVDAKCGTADKCMNRRPSMVLMCVKGIITRWCIPPPEMHTESLNSKSQSAITRKCNTTTHTQLEPKRLRHLRCSSMREVIDSISVWCYLCCYTHVFVICMCS